MRKGMSDAKEPTPSEAALAMALAWAKHVAACERQRQRSAGVAK